jgi:hypothetical protein
MDKEIKCPLCGKPMTKRDYMSGVEWRDGAAFWSYNYDCMECRVASLVPKDTLDKLNNRDET